MALKNIRPPTLALEKFQLTGTDILFVRHRSLHRVGQILIGIQNRLAPKKPTAIQGRTGVRFQILCHLQNFMQSWLSRLGVDMPNVATRFP